jgi:hypothetical protein
MNGEFNSLCSSYYKLFERFRKENAYLKKFMDNAPFYKGETQLYEIDYIISYYRKAQEVKAVAEKTLAAMNKVEADIMYLMRYFNIPARTYLQGEIDDEFEFEVWHEKDQVYVLKTKDVTPVYNPNIYICNRYSQENAESTIFDDEAEWFPK